MRSSLRLASVAALAAFCRADRLAQTVRCHSFRREDLDPSSAAPTSTRNQRLHDLDTLFATTEAAGQAAEWPTAADHPNGLTWTFSCATGLEWQTTARRHVRGIAWAPSLKRWAPAQF